MGSLFTKLWGRLTGAKEMRILILGLDGAGKTSLLSRMHLGKTVPTTPTIGFNVETITYKNLTFQAWDLGGQTAIRSYWKIYYPSTHGVIYVVDSAEKERLELSRSELHLMLQEPQLTARVVLVLANKQDIEGAVSESEIDKYFGLKSSGKEWAVHPCSAKTGEGISTALEWFTSALQK